MEVRTDALICAQRCWQAAIEHLRTGDFSTASALFAARAKYIQRYVNERMERGARLESQGSALPHAVRFGGLVGDSGVWDE